MTHSSAQSADNIERLRLVTRGYELSSRGEIPASQFLRYVEHIRWRTLTGSERIPTRRFMFMGVVRAQALEIFEQVSFDEELELSMWLGRVGTTSMDFSHEVVRVRDGVTVARSTATLVALDKDRRPAPIDPSAGAHVVVRDAASIDRLSGAIPNEAWERPIHVRPSDEDLQGHVNQARYADFVEDTRKLCAAAGGYGPGDFTRPLSRISISYDDEARVGDPLVARTFRGPGERTLDFALVKGNQAIVTRARVELFAGATALR